MNNGPLYVPSDFVVPVPYRYDFRTPEIARHSVRMICDEEGLSLARTEVVDGKKYMPKDVLCAVIEGESDFYNYKPNGEPATHKNVREDGTLGSTDWGICQINDRYHIGPRSDFPSADFVMQNPEKCVRWMIKMYRAGRLNWWCAHTDGSFKKYL